MAFGDFLSSVADRFRQGPFHSADREGDAPNLANGGTSGFHPVNGRAPRSRAARHARQGFQGGAGQGMPQRGFQQQGYPGGAPQTGFQQGYPGGAPQTGFQQGYPGGAPQTGFQQGYPGGVPQTGFQQGYPGGAPQTGFQQGYPGGAPQQQGFRQGYPGGMPQQQGYPGNGMEGTCTRPHQRMNTSGPQMGSGYQGAFQANSQASRSGAQSYWPSQPQQPYQPKFGQEMPQEERSRRFGQEEQPQQAPADNISYMPNLYRDDQGVGHHHVERLTQPMSASTCYRLIEFMRNQESVIVNTELIPDERERQRCLDILFGAAYAMDCTFTRISVKSIYLIAPKTVAVISYESIRQMNEQDAAMRWPNVETEQPAAFRSFRAAK